MVAKVSTIRRKIKNGDKLGFSERARAVNKGLLPSKVKKKNKNCFVEVKNVTLFRNKDTAEFPDAVTSRGSKHLLELIDAIKKGYKSYLLFLVQ